MSSFSTPGLDSAVPAGSVRGMRAGNLPLRQRPVDIVLAVFFAAFTITSIISDLLPTLGVDFSSPSPNPIVNANWWYAHDTDPLFMTPPTWMRIITGLSALVYMPFYPVLVFCLLTGRNAIQLFAVIYATMIVTLTGVVVFGVEFFGDPQWRTPNPAKFLAFNTWYVLVPLVLLLRMRRPLPFHRRF